MLSPQQKADELIEIFGIDLAIRCCFQVLGYMGADRGYEFWSLTKEILIQKQQKQ